MAGEAIGGTRRAAVAITAATLLVQAGQAAADRHTPTPLPQGHAGTQITLSPPVPTPKQRVSITVTGISAVSVAVRLVGATSGNGSASPWLPLALFAGAWQGVLAQPTLDGVYPIELRLAPGTTPLRSPDWLLRVFPAGTLTRPSFATPAAVAADWVAHLAGNQTLVAIRDWPVTTLDRRDRRLNQLLVIAYSPNHDHRLADRLGIWITAVRDGYNGRWRLLEATIFPYRTHTTSRQPRRPAPPA